jgi:hypothetical protein
LSTEGEEPEEMLDEIQRLSGVVTLLAIENPARPLEWWIMQMVERFWLNTYQRTEGGFFAVLYAGDPEIQLLS